MRIMCLVVLVGVTGETYGSLDKPSPTNGRHRPKVSSKIPNRPVMHARSC